MRNDTVVSRARDFGAKLVRVEMDPLNNEQTQASVFNSREEQTQAGVFNPREGVSWYRLLAPLNPVIPLDRLLHCVITSLLACLFTTSQALTEASLNIS